MWLGRGADGSGTESLNQRFQAVAGAGDGADGMAGGGAGEFTGDSGFRGGVGRVWICGDGGAGAGDGRDAGTVCGVDGRTVAVRDFFLQEGGEAVGAERRVGGGNRFERGGAGVVRLGEAGVWSADFDVVWGGIKGDDADVCEY